MTTKKSVKWGELSNVEKDSLVGDTFKCERQDLGFMNDDGAWVENMAHLRYSTDLNAALELAKAKGLHLALYSFGDAHRWSCEIDMGQGGGAADDNPAHAVCIALLKHAGLEIITP